MNLSKSVKPVVFLLFLLTGCATVTPVDPRVTVIDKFLSDDISVTGITSATNSGGFREIQVTGVNRSSYYQKLEYKIEWLDQYGLAISTTLSRWIAFPAYEKSEFRFKAVAPKTTATDFRVLIRKEN